MSLWKRGNVYWSYVFVDGIRYAKSTGTGNRKNAETVERQFKEELNLKSQGIMQPKPDMSFGELAARFLAEGEPRAYHIDRLKPLLAYWSEIPIGRISKGHARDYRKHRHTEKKVSDTTVNRDLEALRHILFWAVDEGFLTGNPLSRVPMVRERHKPRIIVSLEEERKLLEAAAPHLRRIVIAALDTGMRRGEILNQRWEHIDFNRGLLYVSRSKTASGESREIPLTTRMRELLAGDHPSEGFVFTFDGRQVYRLKTGWKAALRRAGLRYFRFHDLRHTHNSRLMLAGVQQEIRKALMGHSSGQDVNEIYTHVEWPAKLAAIQKLEAWVAAQEQPRPEGGHDDRTEGGDGTSPTPTFAPGTAQTLEEKDADRGGARSAQSGSGRRCRQGRRAESCQATTREARSGA